MSLLFVFAFLYSGCTASLYKNEAGGHRLEVKSTFPKDLKKADDWIRENLW